MNIRDRKLVILRQLSQESEPLSLSELMSKLKLDFSERSVRRWLNELIREGMIRKIGHTKNAKYFAVKNSLFDQERISSCFSTNSLEAIEKIKRPLFERRPVSYNDKWLEAYKPNTTFYFPKNLLEKLYEAGNRANNHDPAGTYAHKIFNRLLIDLSYNSSRLEGNTYSLLDTERLLLHGDSADRKFDEEKIMILNHKEAISYLVESASRSEVTKNVICTVHYLLSDGLVKPKYSGKIRDHRVRIGGAAYIPFENPKELEKRLEKFCQKAVLIENPLEQSLFLLIHISYLQAFADVNKRTARLCANLPLITKNFVPLSFSAIEIDDYMSAMIAVYELQDIRPLIDLYVYSYMRTCAAYDSTVKSMGFDEVRVRYRQERREMIRHIITYCLTGHPMQTYIQDEIEKRIPNQDRQFFMEDIYEDLEQLDQTRIVGMGLTLDQLNQWIAKFKQTTL